MSSVCIFCNLPQERIVMQNVRALLIEDGFPVAKGHSLIIPKRHFSSFFEMTPDELKDCYELILVRKDQLLKNPLVKGFNVGINVDQAAGQTVFHCHIHLIPRYVGDVENPRGGVRNIIPGKGDY